MKKPYLNLVALQIEYHWWWIARLKSKREKGFQLTFHRLCADQLQLRYQVLIGLRDSNGEFCH